MQLPVPSFPTEMPANLPPSQKKEWELLQKYLAAGKDAYDKGVFQRSIEVYEKLQEVIPREPHSAKGLALSYEGAGRWKDACKVWDKVITMNLPPGDHLVNYAIALQKTGQTEKAFAMVKDVLKEIDPKPEFKALAHDMKVRLGYLYADEPEDGARQAAGALFSSVLQETDQKHIQAMIGYTTLMFKFGKQKEAMQGTVNLIVQHYEHKEIRAHFTWLARETPNAAETIMEILPMKNNDGATAYAYLAVVLKDQGAVADAIKLYDVACKCITNNASYVLNYSHALSVECRYWESVEVALTFCRNNPDRKVSVNNGDYVLTCKEFLDACSNVCEGRDAEKWLRGSEAIAFAESGKKCVWKNGFGLVDANEEEEIIEVKSCKKGTYAMDELDVIAVWFSVVKNLFTMGCLASLPPLLQILDPLRRGQELHQTLIRNEQAYFAVIAQLAETLTIPVPNPGNTLYVCGDSHSLSPSWRTINIKGTEHLMVNSLVTGLKCWHLRKDAHFYPKYNFLNVVERIPKNSKVMMTVGEIDCREGILVAVEKGRYKDIEEGMNTIITIYIDNLLKLQKEKNFEIYVHPALPVLDVTRKQVITFNDLLGKALAEHPKVKACKKIHWLDFYQDLLTEDNKFKKDYDYDGTHICPSYLKLVQEAFDAL
eukprot:TRINITY_DN8067_c0_g1_i1.p1 TRINITY_DN8067_c0_g1~~TRINITY_DN8067_c0_g1_i1.p1  ORF type:complete len:768 (+),score=192.64 TRINITY_DN8067_c0_g1_i1:342-2306(+)